jgi:hypothetical protein
MAMAIAMVTEIKMKWYINEEAFTHTHTHTKPDLHQSESRLEDQNPSSKSFSV